MKRRITMVVGMHLTVLDRKMINAALNAGKEDVHTKHGSKTSKSLHMEPTDKKAEVERYRLSTWWRDRAEAAEKYVVRGKLYHVSLTQTNGCISQYTIDVVESV